MYIIWREKNKKKSKSCSKTRFKNPFILERWWTWVCISKLTRYPWKRKKESIPLWFVPTIYYWQKRNRKKKSNIWTFNSKLARVSNTVLEKERRKNKLKRSDGYLDELLQRVVGEGRYWSVSACCTEDPSELSPIWSVMILEAGKLRWSLALPIGEKSSSPDPSDCPSYMQRPSTLCSCNACINIHAWMCIYICQTLIT